MTDTQSEQGKNKMYKVITGMFIGLVVIFFLVMSTFPSIGVVELIILTIAVLTTLAVFICLVGGTVLIVRKLLV